MTKKLEDLNEEEFKIEFDLSLERLIERGYLMKIDDKYMVTNIGRKWHDDGFPDEP